MGVFIDFHNDNFEGENDEDGVEINFYQDDKFSIISHEPSLREWAEGEFNTIEEVEEFLAQIESDRYED